MYCEILKHHEKQVSLYKEYKKQLLSDKNSLVIEFDFAQNLPIPKLPVNEQYYNRLLWPFAFNVHIHNSKLNNKSKKEKDKSYIFFNVRRVS